MKRYDFVLERGSGFDPFAVDINIRRFVGNAPFALASGKGCYSINIDPAYSESVNRIMAQLGYRPAEGEILDIGDGVM